LALTPVQREPLESLFERHGCSDFRWIAPEQIIVAQWVRMKCMFGCGEYGRCGTCPPNTPSVAECERFFREYREAVVFHFPKTVASPEDRHAWSRGINARLFKLERAVFLAGFERAFCLYMDSCGFCSECAGDLSTCKEPRIARPSPEAMAMDVYATVRRFGYSIKVRSGVDQQMDRFAFLMVQ
jgi:predicted metal-binding protein